MVNLINVIFNISLKLKYSENIDFKRVRGYIGFKV